MGQTQKVVRKGSGILIPEQKTPCIPMLLKRCMSALVLATYFTPPAGNAGWGLGTSPEGYRGIP